MAKSKHIRWYARGNVASTEKHEVCDMEDGFSGEAWSACTKSGTIRSRNPNTKRNPNQVHSVIEVRNEE